MTSLATCFHRIAALSKYPGVTSEEHNLGSDDQFSRFVPWSGQAREHILARVATTAPPAYEGCRSSEIGQVHAPAVSAGPLNSV